MEKHLKIIAYPALISFLVAGCAAMKEISMNLSAKKTATPTFSYKKTDYVLVDSPEIYSGPKGTKIRLGGFSGLHFLGKNPKNQENQFLTLTDRGPNSELMDVPNVGKKLRPFVMPSFNPQIVKLETDSANKTLKIVERIALTDPRGKLLTGLPNLPLFDEKPIDTRGRPLNFDLLGVDSESITVDPDGNLWVSEEYRPSILKFTSKGRLEKRYTPQGAFDVGELKSLNTKYKKKIIYDILPSDFALRKANRGFEGLVYARGHLFAVLQSPIPLSDRKNEQSVRLVELDPDKDEVISQAVYLLSDKNADKIGDLSYDSTTNQFLIIEQNGEVGPKSIHQIFSFNYKPLDFDYRPELSPLEEVKALSSPKTLVADLVLAGYQSFEKVEGLSLIGPRTYAVMNDDDFQLAGLPDLKTGAVPVDSNRATVLSIIEVSEPLSR